VSLPAPATVASLLDHLAERPEALSGTSAAGNVPLAHLLVAVNGRLIQHQQGFETPLADGDLVTLMPPVMGG
jgi:molybdopterin synthase sulfur carrier subunit